MCRNRLRQKTRSSILDNLHNFPESLQNAIQHIARFGWPCNWHLDFVGESNLARLLWSIRSTCIDSEKVKIWSQVLSRASFHRLYTNTGTFTLTRFGPYFVSPIVIGLEDGIPVIATYDSIGCKTISENFASAGTAYEGLFGIAESYNRLDYNPEELENALANCLLSGCDRDILSGYGGVIYIM